VPLWRALRWFQGQGPLRGRHPPLLPATCASAKAGKQPADTVQQVGCCYLHVGHTRTPGLGNAHGVPMTAQTSGDRNDGGQPLGLPKGALIPPPLSRGPAVGIMRARSG
jgi:hypothetical protein